MAEIKKISTELQLLDKFLDTSGDAGTSGQVLTSTGTGINWVSGGSLPGGPYLPLTAGSTKPLSGNLYFSAAASYIFGGDDEILAGQDGNAYYYATGNGQNLTKPVFIGDNNAYIRFNSGNSERMRITNAGNVGIGTTAPITKLQISATNATSPTANIFLDVDGNNVPGMGGQIVFGTSTSGTLTSYNARIQGVRSGLDNGSSDIHFQTTHVATATTPSTKMTILSGGNVGIGTTSPGSILELNGSGGNNKQLRLATSAATYWDIGRSFSTGHFEITEDSGNTYFIIDKDNGNVGIGTTSPSEKLEVIGKTKITQSGAALYVNSSNANGSYVTWENDGTDIGYIGAGYHMWSSPNNIATSLGIRANTRLDLGVQASVYMTILSSGNVGIGTTSPGQKLEVAGIARFRESFGIEIASPGAGPIITFGSTSDYDAFGSIGHQASQYQFVTQSRPFNFINGSTSQMLINSSGNVGIGTTSPGTALQVGGLDDGSNYDITVGWNAVSSQAVGTKRSALTFKTSQTGVNNEDIYKWDIAMVTAPATASNEPFGSDLAFLRSTRSSTSVDETTMILTQLGNVGIGDSSPSFKLDVNVTSSRARFKATTGDANIELSSIAGHDWLIQSKSDDSFVIYDEDASSARLTIDSSGNVGIGTTSPTYKLHVQSPDANDDVVYIHHDNAAQSSGTLLKVRTDAGDSNGYTLLDVQTNSGSALFVRGDRKVGIGTTSPTNKLHIQGSQATVYSSTDTGGQASVGTTINNTNTAGNTNNFSQLLFTVGTNNNSVSRIVAIRSGSDASDLAFVGKSASGVAEYMRIKSGGNVGIGVDNPSALLEVRKGSISGQIAKFSAINPHVVIESSTAGNAVLHLKPNTTGTKSGQFKVTAGNGYNFRWSNDASGTAETAYMDLDTSTTGGGDLTVKGDVIAYGSPSDKKYKENIKPIESALDKAMQLQGVTFDWKDSESILEIKEDIGFIAQDVQEVLPELVRDNGKGNLSLRYQGITPILLEAIKELKAEIEELKLNNCNCNK